MAGPAQRSQRNKIVTLLTGMAGAAIVVENGTQGLIPPGWGVVFSQLATIAALAVNLFWTS